MDAFGLSSFHSPAIKRDAIAKRIIEKEFKDRGPIPAEKKKSKVKRYVAVAIALPLLFAMASRLIAGEWKLDNPNASNKKFVGAGSNWMFFSTSKKSVPTSSILTFAPFFNWTYISLKK